MEAPWQRGSCPRTPARAQRADLAAGCRAARRQPLPDSMHLAKVTNAFFGDASERTVLGLTFREMPMITITMRASTWRTVLGYECICDPSNTTCLRSQLPAYINTELRRVLGYTTPDMVCNHWSMDQWLASYKLHKASDVLGQTQLVPRNTGKDRIDRIGWPDVQWSEAALASRVDAHVLRPGHEVGLWTQMQALVRTALMIHDAREDQALWRQVEQYVEEFRAAVNTTQNYGLMPEDEKERKVQLRGGSGLL